MLWFCSQTSHPALFFPHACSDQWTALSSRTVLTPDQMSLGLSMLCEQGSAPVQVVRSVIPHTFHAPYIHESTHCFLQVAHITLFAAVNFIILVPRYSMAPTNKLYCACLPSSPCACCRSTACPRRRRPLSRGTGCVERPVVTPHSSRTCRPCVGGRCAIEG